MKLPSSLLAPCIAVMALSLAQASAQSSPDSPSHSMQQDSQPASLASSLSKGERKLTGCIGSENGKYFVESRLHKKTWLSGSEDFALQAGHKVILYGNFLNESAPKTTARADHGQVAETSSSRQENNFQVSKVEMVSDACPGKNIQGPKNSSHEP
jgi:hypothetical protein